MTGVVKKVHRALSQGQVVVFTCRRTGQGLFEKSLSTHLGKITSIEKIDKKLYFQIRRKGLKFLVKNIIRKVNQEDPKPADTDTGDGE